MTIRRATDDIEIKEGDYILGNPFINYHLVGNTGKVTRIAGKRIYYDRFHDDVLDSTHMNHDQVRFVCDTKEEVEQLQIMSQARYRDISTAVSNLELRIGYEFDVRLNALVEGSEC